MLIEMFLQKSKSEDSLVFLGRFVRFRFRMGKKSMGLFLVEPKWSEKKPKSCLNLCEKYPSSYSSLAAVYIYII